MVKTNIFQNPVEVQSRLTTLGFTVEELATVALKAVSAKNEATRFHPSNASGLFSYLWGTSALREMAVPKDGWELDRTSNIESIFNRSMNIKIIFQNVDSACSFAPPKAISGKGNAVQDLVGNTTGAFLFEDMEEEHIKNIQNNGTWFFCVSSDEDGEVRAELSLPSSMQGKQFGSFHERIFIINDSRWDAPIDLNNDDLLDDDNDDFDISITRK